MDDLERLAAELHERGMSLCVDLVINHTAARARVGAAAMAGEADYRDLYHVFPDRTEPDAYERTLREVFPDFAPGNFSWVAGARRAGCGRPSTSSSGTSTTRNPDVLAGCSRRCSSSPTAGVEVLRLDAVPFIWKRLGTDCENQPEAHRLLQAFRALVRIAAPGVAFKAEAIVAPERPDRSTSAPTSVYRPSATSRTTTSSW